MKKLFIFIIILSFVYTFSILTVEAANKMAKIVKISSANVFEIENLAVWTDGIKPSKDLANIHTIPRATFWPNKGTEEVVTIKFKSPVKSKGIQIFWYDDEDIDGGCRIPKLWKAEVLLSNGKKVKYKKSKIALNKFDVLKFRKATVKAIKITITLKEGYSTGIIEMELL